MFLQVIEFEVLDGTSLSKCFHWMLELQREVNKTKQIIPPVALLNDMEAVELKTCVRECLVGLKHQLDKKKNIPFSSITYLVDSVFFNVNGQLKVGACTVEHCTFKDDKMLISNT